MVREYFFFFYFRLFQIYTINVNLGWEFSSLLI
nr:MAG TPA: hypothetical protein [Caudoviricetes sp.]